MYFSKQSSLGDARALLRFPMAAVALAAAGTAHLAAAQQGPAMGTTVVTAARSETLLDETLADVQVITSEQISRSNGRSLAEILQRFGGATMSNNGGRGNTQSVYLRGSSQVIMLIDGVRYGSATVGVPTLESLPIEAIDRIEVMHGPASALYGSDAMGGVIQIFTKQGKGAKKAFEPYASVTLGRAGYKKADGGFSGAQNGWNYSLNMARVLEPGFSSTNAKSADYRPDADKFNQSSVSAALGYAFNADWRIDANLMRADSYSEFDQGYVYMDDGSYPLVDGSYSDLRAATSQIKLSGKLAPNWKSSLSMSHSDDKQKTFHRIVGSTARYQDLFRTEQNEYKWTNEIATPVGVVIAGTERLEQKIASTSVYDKTKRTTDSVYAGINGSHAAHSWQANVRRDDNSQFGHYNTWGLAYGYEVVQGLRLHASRSSSLKAPTFNDLYYPYSGNPNLRPVQSHSNEVGVQWTHDRHQVKLTRYDNKVRDLISWADDGTGMWFPFNVDSARLKGWTLGYHTDWQGWKLGATYSHLDAHDGEGTRMTDRMPEHQATLSLDKQMGAWKLGANALYVGERTDNRGAYQLRSYTTVDMYAEYQIRPEWSVQARVVNLTDKAYETAYGYNQRGRAGYLTLKWTPR